MSFLPKHIVGIDFHDYSGQLVELKFVKDKTYLEAYNRIPIPQNVIKDGDIINETEFKNLLTKLLQTANPKAIESREIAIIFPSSKIFTHIFSFPGNLNRDEIRTALPFEAEGVIPFSMNDIYWDFTVLENDSTKTQSRQQVLFASVMKYTADKYTEILQSLELTPILFGIDTESLFFGIKKQLEPGKNSLIMDINTLSIDYLLLKNQTIKYFFSGNKGGKSLIKKLSEEFQTPEATILDKKEKNALEKTYFPTISKFIERNYKVGQKIIEEKKSLVGKVDNVYLTGEFLNLPGFYEFAQKAFPDKKIHIGDPRTYLTVNADQFNPPKAEEKGTPYSTYFINAVGIGLRALDKNEGINLLSDSFRESTKTKKHHLLMGISAILMTIISLTTATFLFFKHQDLFYQRLSLEIKKNNVTQLLYGTRYQDIYKEIENFNKEVAELSAIDNSLFTLPGTIDKIYKLLPEGIEITSINFTDSDLTIELTGIAATREALLQTHQNFKTAEFIEQVITPISNYDEKFEISFSLKLKLLFKELEKYGTSTT